MIACATSGQMLTNISVFCSRVTWQFVPRVAPMLPPAKHIAATLPQHSSDWCAHQKAQIVRNKPLRQSTSRKPTRLKEGAPCLSLLIQNLIN